MQHLLYLTHRIPYPPNKGDKIRAFHTLAWLQRHFRVHLGCFVDDPDDWRHADRLAAGCASSCLLPLHPLRARVASLRGLLRGEALSLPYYRDAAMGRWVADTLDRQPVRAALAFSGPMAQYLPAATPHGPLLRVMDLVDVDSEKWRAYGAGRRGPLAALYRREARLLLAHERGVAAGFERTALVSPAEAALFRQLAPESRDRIIHVCNGVDAAYFSPAGDHLNPYGADAAAPVLVFTGAMDYWPNIDAVTWFAQRVLPPLLAQFAGLTFYIVGARPAAAVLRLAALPGVRVTGAVADMRPYLRHATLAVAPLRIARGVQNKVLEAMAMEKTVLASPQALEGIVATPGHDVLCAAGHDEFIAQTSMALRQLLAGDWAAVERGRAARRCVLQDYQWETNLRALGAALNLSGVCGADRVAPDGPRNLAEAAS